MLCIGVESAQRPHISEMAEDEPQSSKRVLDPVERWSEVLFGLIMVLGFTSTVSAVHAGNPEFAQ